MTPPSVAIVIVNWNGREFLGDCLSALREIDYARDRLQILVVDNGSSDGSVEFVRSAFPEVPVHEHEVNNYARANNFGVRTTTTDYVAFLNSDARVDRLWLTRLVAALEADPRAGGAGSKILFTDGRLNSTGLELLPGFHFRDRGFGEPDHGQFASGEVAGLSGCAVLWRRTALRAAGLLDEDFEMYYEDVDESFRMRKCGWKLLYVADSIVHHLYNASIKKSPRRNKDYYGERNRLFLLARHASHDLPGYLLRSRAVIEASAFQFKRMMPLVLKKWMESGAAPKAADALYRAAYGAKIELSRFRRWAKTEARQLRKIQPVYERAVRDAQRERDEARNVFGRMMVEAERSRDAAREAFWSEVQRREEREKWLRIVMTEIKMRRVRELDESEQRFLEAMASNDEEQAARAQASDNNQPSSSQATQKT